MQMTLYVPGEFRPARFVQRLNRFVAQVEIDGAVLEAHVPTSGRLGELLLPGAPVQVRKGTGSKRKTAWDLMLVKTGDTWVSLDSRLPNYLVGQLLREDELPPFAGARDIKPEYVWRESPGLCLHRRRWSAHPGGSQVGDPGGGRAGNVSRRPTSRGARHLRELAQAVGRVTGLQLFIVQRDDATEFAPNWRTDPAFAQALAEAEAAGVEIYAWKCKAEANALACDIGDASFCRRKECSYGLPIILRRR